MSLLGYDMNGTATINGLSNVNANEVYGDNLYYDSSTTPVNVKTAIASVDADVTILEGQMITANSNISTLQGQMTTANSNIATLQGQVSTLQSEMNTAQDDINDLESDMNTAQSDINTLQSEMNTAQGDINDLQSDVIALGVSTGITAATVAGLVISQASQDVTNADTVCGNSDILRCL